VNSSAFDGDQLIMVLQFGNTSAREPAVAGLFYPGDASELRDEVTELLERAAPPADIDPQQVKALIAPHAGYVYSGRVAALAYKLIAARRTQIRRVVLVGPSHRVYFHGVALPTTPAFSTPLGDVPLDRQSIDALAGRSDVLASDAPHAMEHSLEVHLPFLQVALEEFTLIPIVTGDAAPGHVASVLNAVWADPNTLIIASSDLSHYLPTRRHSASMHRPVRRSLRALRRCNRTRPAVRYRSTPC
jgi:AmmeMemoRadiSam system protein B